MGTQGTGRKRSTKKERSTAEDDALNLIAREAEARLAAKRAARAEAREIRMKELERQQKEIFQVQKKYYGLDTKLDDRTDSKWGDIEQWMEDSERYSRSSRIQTLSDDDERMSVGSRGSVRVEDRDYLEKGSRAASALTAATLTSVGGTSSRRGSGETAIAIDAETSIREIKEIHELKDQIQDVESKYTQNLKEVKDALGEVEEKYRKAMVSNAQLDNEKNNLMYQVDTLKDSLMELEELLSESRRGYEDKVKEYEREKHSHTVLQFQFTEMKETLKQSEELLNDIRQLRIKQEGFVREISDLQETVEWKDKKIGALERQKEYTDAIRIERDELREETVKLKDILKKHGIVLGPDLNINGELGEAEVVETPGADHVTQPAADAQGAPTEGNSMLGDTEETPLRSCREEEAAPEQHRLFEEGKRHHASGDALCAAAGSTLETSGEEQATCLQEDKTDTEEHNVDNGVLIKDLNVDVIDGSIIEAKDIIVCSPELHEIVNSSVGNVPITEVPKGGDVGETEPKVQSVNSHHDDHREEQDHKREDGESNLQSTESCPQQKVAQDLLTECLPDERNPTVSNTEHQHEPEEADEAENDEAEEMPGKCQPQDTAASGKKKKRKRRGKKKGTHEDKNQQKERSDPEKGKREMHSESAARNNGTPAEPGLHGSASETLSESRVDQEPGETGFTNEAAVEPVPDEQDHQHKVETEPTASPEEETMDPFTDKHSRGLNLETETVKEEEAVAPAEHFPPRETLNNCRKDERDVEPDKVEEVGGVTSPVPETNLSPSDGSSTVPHNESRVVRSVEDQVGSVDEMQSECATNNPENTYETSSKDHKESHFLSNGDIAADPSESVSQSSPDVSADSSSGSTPPAAQNSPGAAASVEVSGGGPEETTETLNDDAETEQESSPAQRPHGGDSELIADATKEQELDRGLGDDEDLVEPDQSPTESGDSCASLTINPDALDSVSLLETVGAAQAEQLGHVQSQDESSETEKSNTIDASQMPDSPKGATEMCSSPEQDRRADPERGNQMSSNETPQPHEPVKDEPEDKDPSHPTPRDADEEDEGLSFDFDDMEVEAAVGTSLLGNLSQEEVEEGVEVMPDESNNTGLTGEDGAEEPAEGPVDGGHQGDSRDTGPPDNSNSQEDALSQQRGSVERVCEKQTEVPEEGDEAGHIPEEGEVCVVAEDIDQVAPLPVEEGLDAAKHEDLPRRAEEGGSSKEPQQAGKDVKRNNKRGKGKGKEDCKMS
uniref:Leucine rich repeat (in FLII) interacting protein 1a n=2 Tax=Gasterosteus aculeatus aculeatus TaxID=481459 RepID=A0AAQ4NY73_GASAC|nr:leucine-rich repeat flightless-interacting protein 1 isoform X11 [Gasterosteus aculeatus aculeatus]